jgi:hypothetical protein
MQETLQAICVFIIMSIIIIGIILYNTYNNEHIILTTPSQLQQIEKSCDKNEGLLSVIFYRSPTTLGAKIQCIDGASFTINFLGKSEKSLNESK